MMQFSRLLLLLLLLRAIDASAQPGLQDSIRTDIADRSRKTKIERVNYNVRAAVGIQSSFYFDAGISGDYLWAADHGYVGFMLYTAFSMFPAMHSDAKAVPGAKIGAELFASGGLLGLEISSYWADRNNDVMLTPRVGLGFGLVNLSYAYSISTNSRPFSQIGKHAIALQCNIPFRRKNLLNAKSGK